ncbi:hypothetical protein [Ferruginivarius sediminum]|uniref:Uncharacterized protein n=1 Tax=Ferruginivarius sediminum TaxID=2661937 RepID=A0A369TF81_9PROT|nr:hypothetical protein [Ferruginivarius sediminum]RDD63244.1 hypothetical protein DRB17_01985 [Ferruginivarius sediminum]
MAFPESAKGAALMPAAHLHGAGDSNRPGQGNETSGEFGFADLLDVINPLQHIPGVSTVYREITGDSIQAPARVAGGALFGGPIGFVASTFETIMTEATGDDIGGHVMASLFGEPDASQTAPTAVAEADPAKTQQPSAQLAERETGSADTHQAAREEGEQRVLTGNEALAALAADLRGESGAGHRASDQVAANNAADQEDESRDAQRSEMQFFPIRAKDYNHSATLRAESVEKLRAAAAADEGRTQAAPTHRALVNETGQQPPQQDTDTLPDFAQRMRSALEKYRAMHEKQ